MERRRPPPAMRKIATAKQARHSPQQLDNEFIDRFAIAGPPEEVRTRLEAIQACGIERLIIVPGSLDTAPQLVRQSIERFAREVLPALVA